MIYRQKGLIKKIFPNYKDLFISAILGLSIAGTIYLGFLQRHFFSHRYLVIALLIAGSITVLSSLLNRKLIIPSYLTLSKNLKIFVILFSSCFGLLLLLNTQIQPIYYLLPNSTLEINILIDDLPEGEENVNLLWIKTGQGYVHYTSIEFQGQWERKNNKIFFPSNQSVILKWNGKVGPEPEIAFSHTTFDQPVAISWNGQTTNYQLNDPSNPIIYIHTPIHIPILNYLPFTFCFIVSVVYGIFSALILLCKWNIPNQPKQSTRKYDWLLFTLPMLTMWVFALLVFWPGILSNDSIAIWEQGMQEDFSDWHSVFYSILIAFNYRFFNSPAIFLIIQITLLSITVAWGLSVLEKVGVSRVVLWILSFVMAFFPPNIILSITLWKDIPYAISLLLLTVFLLRIVLSKGKWGVEKHHWIWICLAGFFVGVFRQNGLAVAFISLLLPPLVFRKYWKTYTKSFIIAVFLYIVVSGPIYDLFVDNKQDSGKINLVYLHHIAAHVDAGTELSKSEEEYLGNLLPLGNWKYSPCYVGTISQSTNFDRDNLYANTNENRYLAIKLFVRNPLVNIRHVLQAGEMAWKFNNTQCYIKSTHGLNSWKPGEEDWVVPNDTGLTEASLFPRYIQTYVKLLRYFGFFDDQIAVLLRPAFWLYIFIFCMAVLILRWNYFQILLISIPILSQSAILLMIAFASAYRYYYGTCLVGILFLGFLFIPQQNVHE